MKYPAGTGQIQQHTYQDTYRELNFTTLSTSSTNTTCMYRHVFLILFENLLTGKFPNMWILQLNCRGMFSTFYVCALGPISQHCSAMSRLVMLTICTVHVLHNILLTVSTISQQCLAWLCFGCMCIENSIVTSNFSTVQTHLFRHVLVP